MLENPYLYMSLLGLMVKILAAYRLKNNLQIPGAMLCMLFLFVVYAQTVLELVAFYSVANPNHNILLILKSYYLMLIASVLIIPVLFFNIINNRISGVMSSVIVLVFIFMAALLFSDTIIKEAIYTKFTITRVKGEQYWIMQLFFIISLITISSSLIYTYKTTPIELIRVKSANLLIAFALVVLGGVGIIAMMAAQVPITGVGFIPILFGILIVVMAESLQQNSILDLRTIIPGTRKFMYAAKVLKPIVISTNQSYSSEDYLKQYERLLMDIADMQFSSQKEKMEFLKKSKTTYYRTLKERVN